MEAASSADARPDVHQELESGNSALNRSAQCETIHCAGPKSMVFPASRCSIASSALLTSITHIPESGTAAELLTLFSSVHVDAPTPRAELTDPEPYSDSATWS